MIVKRLAGIAIMLASFALAAWVIRNQPHVEHIIRSFGRLAYPAAVAIFTVVAAAPFSITDALAVMNGAIFGPFRGAIINSVGIFLASLLAYWINRRASHLLDLDAAIERLPRWAKRFPVGSPGFLIAVRIIPGLGGTVATATAAAFRVPIWVHVWTMCVVAIPLCILLAVFGHGVTEWVHHEERRAHIYLQHHRMHLHFRLHRRGPASAPSPTP